MWTRIFVCLFLLPIASLPCLPGILLTVVIISWNLTDIIIVSLLILDSFKQLSCKLPITVAYCDSQYSAINLDISMACCEIGFLLSTIKTNQLVSFIFLIGASEKTNSNGQLATSQFTSSHDTENHSKWTQKYD